MISQLGNLETRQIDSLDREELMSTILNLKEYTRINFSQQWLNHQPSDRLRMLLLAMKLFRVLGAPDVGSLHLETGEK
jgi:hypothetical protein